MASHYSPLQVGLHAVTVYQARIITYNTRLRFQTYFNALTTPLMHPVLIKRSLIQVSTAVSNTYQSNLKNLSSINF
jgi:hypothetical protein